jgi:hypothetical protein
MILNQVSLIGRRLLEEIQHQMLNIMCRLLRFSLIFDPAAHLAHWLLSHSSMGSGKSPILRYAKPLIP